MVVEGHCCIEPKGVLAIHQSGKTDRSGTLETIINPTSGRVLRGFRVGRLTSPG
jgi:hypothetical protein